MNLFIQLVIAEIRTLVFLLICSCNKTVSKEGAHFQCIFLLLPFWMSLTFQIICSLLPRCSPARFILFCQMSSLGPSQSYTHIHSSPFSCHPPRRWPAPGSDLSTTEFCGADLLHEAADSHQNVTNNNFIPPGVFKALWINCAAEKKNWLISKLGRSWAGTP